MFMLAINQDCLFLQGSFNDAVKNSILCINKYCIAFQNIHHPIVKSFVLFQKHH